MSNDVLSKVIRYHERAEFSTAMTLNNAQSLRKNLSRLIEARVQHIAKIKPSSPAKPDAETRQEISETERAIKRERKLIDALKKYEDSYNDQTIADFVRVST